MIKTKIKQVSYERLASDPHGFNNTRIGMVANLEKGENPIPVINELRMLVEGRQEAYQEVREAKSKIETLQYSLKHMKTSLLQIKLGDDQIEKLNELKKGIAENEIEIQKLIKRTFDITG